MFLMKEGDAMTEKMIRDAYCRIRTIDQSIPDDVLDFIKDAAIEKLQQKQRKEMGERTPINKFDIESLGFTCYDTDSQSYVKGMVVVTLLPHNGTNKPIVKILCPRRFITLEHIKTMEQLKELYRILENKTLYDMTRNYETNEI